MRIALYGYGKMGKAIEQAAIAKGHEVTLKVGSANAGTPPAGCDVAIEFSRPERALENIRRCLDARVPVVVGTTGWYAHLDEVRAWVNHSGGTLLWASNFSIGVNLFFQLNRYLAGLMDPQARYQVHIDEVHHVHKLDAPSGTAITLARDIDLKTQRYSGHILTEAMDLPEHQEGTPTPVPVRSERTGEVPGKHSITWTSPEDRITITHDAFGRQGFATGAVVAAEWVRGRRGLFTMADVLGG
ncbi:MAG TPA: 4-hydroxy-tetrahydrodipicolinate reductase [Flavobacteriales bacterium]|nr:4-hydroxy-tetrahydrodipicolinate reductase [Flavobacteriales bacterium]